MLRSCVRLLLSEMKLIVFNVEFMLIKANITDGRRPILHYIVISSFFYGGHLENHPKWRGGPKISSGNILILN